MMTNSNAYKILLVDDEPDILEFLSYNLLKEGYQVFTTNSGINALRIAREVQPHLILLDVMMNDMDGIETCTELRAINEINHCIIVFLTARGEDYAQIAGFEAGADDYVTKPVKPKVLISRIAALLKRFDFTLQQMNDLSKDATYIQHRDLKLDRERYLVVHGDNEITLARKEFELLSLLYLKPNIVFTRDVIFRSIWGDDVSVGDRTIDVHIRKIRDKIGEKYIKTIKGVGYKFVD